MWQENRVLNVAENSADLNFLSTALFFALFASLAVIYQVLKYANVGFDLTDEGYYFNWISNPWIYKYYVSQFGYVYHGLFNLLDQSIASLRQVNALICFGLAWVLSFLVLVPKSQTFQTLENKRFFFAISFLLATPALFILMITGHWLATPSYNSLNFQGYLIALIGVLLVHFCQNKKSLWGWVLIGIGGWLSFMAKPPSAAALGLVISVYFLATKQWKWHAVLVGVLSAALCLTLSAYYIDGSVPKFVTRYQQGLLALGLMGSTHGLLNLFKLDFFSLSPLFKTQLLSAAFFTAFAIHISKEYFSEKTSQCTKNVSALIATIFVLISLLIALKISAQSVEVKRYQGLIMLALPFGFFLYGITKCIFRGKSNSRQKMIISFLLIVLPYCFSIGTNNNYWQTAAGASVFWVLAAINLILPEHKNGKNLLSIMPVVALILLLAINVIMNAIANPYRQNVSLFSQKNSIEIRKNQTILLSDETAQYLNTLKAIAINAGFSPKTPMIDLTGHHPGALYFLNATAIGQAWTIGGYPGSDQLARFALDSVGCDQIGNAWILIEKDGHRRITDQLLKKDGIYLNKENYKVVGKLPTRNLKWDKKIRDKKLFYTQFLVRPIHPKELSNNCFAARLNLKNSQ